MLSVPRASPRSALGSATAPPASCSVRRGTVPQHDHDHHQDDQRIDGGIRAAAPPSARRLASYPSSGRLSFLRHIVELPRWCGQRTALHLNVAPARDLNTNQPRGLNRPGAQYRQEPNHRGNLSRFAALMGERHSRPIGVGPLSALRRCGLIAARNHVAACPDNGRRRRHRSRVCARLHGERRESLRLRHRRQSRSPQLPRKSLA